jgi:hypothetical protein
LTKTLAQEINAKTKEKILQKKFLLCLQLLLLPYILCKDATEEISLNEDTLLISFFTSPKLDKSFSASTIKAVRLTALYCLYFSRNSQF